MIQKVHKSIEIKAPVEKVFSYLEDPNNEPEWIESIVDVKNICGSGYGTHYERSWKMGGIKLHGETTRKEDIPNERIVDETRGDGINTWTYTFESNGNTTTVGLDLEYNIPVPVRWKLAHEYVQEITDFFTLMPHGPVMENLVDAVIVKHIEREVEMDMQNIKDRFEI